jgi:hypothetical protein
MEAGLYSRARDKTRSRFRAHQQYWRSSNDRTRPQAIVGKGRDELPSSLEQNGRTAI